MNARELADKISDILDEADSSFDAMAALAEVQFTVWAATHCHVCKSFQPIDKYAEIIKKKWGR